MMDYFVTRFETYKVRYRISAANPISAIRQLKLFHEAESLPVPESVEFYEVNCDIGMPVDEIKPPIAQEMIPCLHDLMDRDHEFFESIDSVRIAKS